MNTLTSFDGIRIAYYDEGEGPAVILLHGGYLDGLGQFGDFRAYASVGGKAARDVPAGVWGSAPASQSSPRRTARHGARTAGRRSPHHTARHAGFWTVRQTAGESRLRELSNGPGRRSTH